MNRKRPINLKLKACIIESGKTLDEVAESIGVTKSALSRKINGYIPFKEFEIQIIASFLNRSITEIFFTYKVELKETNAM